MARPEKVAVVEEIKEKLESAEAVFITEYRGLTVGQQQELRRSLTKANAEYKKHDSTVRNLQWHITKQKNLLDQFAEDIGDRPDELNEKDADRYRELLGSDEEAGIIERLWRARIEGFLWRIRIPGSLCLQHHGQPRQRSTLGTFNVGTELPGIGPL